MPSGCLHLLSGIFKVSSLSINFSGSVFVFMSSHLIYLISLHTHPKTKAQANSEEETHHRGQAIGLQL